MAPKEETVTIENAQIIFRNFKGEKREFNAKGDRNFCVVLPPELAEQLLDTGLNVKYLKPREEGDEPKPYLKVNVKYSDNPRARPPRVVLISSRGRTDLDESTVEMLDYVYSDNVDLIFRMWEYDVRGNTGKSAYLKSIFVTMAEDELDRKYADVPDAAPLPKEYAETNRWEEA